MRPSALLRVLASVLLWLSLVALPRSALAAPPAAAAAAAAGLTIVSPVAEATVAGGELTLVLRLPPQGARAVQQVLVDGAPVTPLPAPAERGILLPGQAAPDDPTLLRVRVPLAAVAGPRTIRVIPDAGPPAEVRVQVSPPQLGPPRSRLILLSIGVGQYQAESLRLRYPAKDARDLAERFTGQAGLLFSEVKTRVLVDQSADKGHVLDGLEWLQRETTARDVAVLFLAGHGVRDGATGVYYYLPWDADLQAVKRTMVSQDDIKTTLRALPGKVVVFLDTCFSGSLYTGAERAPSVVEDLVQNLLATDNGTVVFASTSGTQTAREAPEWGNGVFTKAVVEGLAGQAAGPGSSSVTITELTLYVSERVKALTGGTQTPTLALPRGVADFPIAAVPPEGESPSVRAALQSPASPAPTPAPPAAAAPRSNAWLVWTFVGIGAVVLAGGITAAVLLTRPPTYTPNPAF